VCSGVVEFPLQRRDDEFRELQIEGLVEAQLGDQRVVLRLREILPQHDQHGIADIAEQRERNERNRQHHEDGLQQAADDEGDH
jgi:hypothetical protein